VKKVRKEAPERKEIKATKVKKVIKETKDFPELWEIKDHEVIKVFAENRAKEARKVIWDTVDLLEIRVQLENPEIKANLVKLEYQVIRVIRGIKEKLDPWATRAIKERWECKERLESQVIQEAREKLEKEEPLVFQERGVYQVIKEFAEIREIKAKGANKEKEVYRVNRVSAEIAVNRARRGLLERRAFQVIRVPEEIRASVEIRGRMVILDQWESRDYRENRVKKDYLVIEENRVIRDRKDIEVINSKIIILFRIWEVGSRLANLKKIEVN
jgi:hypothetical protein